jgi:EF hand
MHKTLAAAATALTLAFALAGPAQAQEATAWPDMMLKMADANKDGMVTRQEFIDAMSKMWDQKHAAMMKTDSKMKAGMMDKAQFMAFARVMFVDPGKIGGN